MKNNNNKTPKVLSDKEKKVREWIIDLIFFISGSCLFAVGVNMFAIPNDISNGGATGIATILHELFPVLPVGMTMFGVNVPLFILAFIYLGRDLFLKSFVATLILSVTTDIFALFIPRGTDDGLLAAIFYGVSLGAGLSLIFMRNATSGGSDIVAKLINKKYPFFPLGRTVFLVDLVVIVASGFVFHSIEKALYSAIVIFVSGEVIDLILYGRDHSKTYFIVTDKPEEMATNIIMNVGRGVSVLPAKGGYTWQDKNMLICACRTSETTKLNKVVKATDENAFVIVADASEVLGQGFRKITEEDK